MDDDADNQSGPQPPARKWRHELRTPLNQIIGYAAMLREEAEDDGPASFVKDLNRIEQAGWHLLKLIDELFDTRLVDTDPNKAIRRPTSEPVAAAHLRRPSTAPVLAIAGEVARPPTAPVLPLDTQAPESATILVVDDNDDNRNLLARRLAQRDYAVVSASGGAEALAIVAERPVDLVLLDVMMPGIDGFEVLVRLRERFGQIELPVIMTTALDSSASIVKSLRLGANDYVTKPLDFDVVMARVNTQLALKRTRDRLEVLTAQLERTEERIARGVNLNDAAQRIRDWAAPIASELAAIIGAKDVTVWFFEGEQAERVVGEVEVPPSWEEIEALTDVGHRLSPSRAVFALSGIAQQTCGVLMVSGDYLKWRAEQVNLVARFARHLGSALELRRMRRELAAQTERRRLSEAALIEKGFGVLRLCPGCGRCYDQQHDRCADHDVRLEARRVVPYRIAARYRLVREIGTGAMGTVFKAHDERLDRDVAVKIVWSESFQSPDVRLRCENEARIIARVEHPNVIAVYDSGELTDGSLFSVMELLHGRDLGTILNRWGPGRPEQVASILRQGAAALAAAHRAGLVHRDVKPDNIFLIGEGPLFQAKVLDFGIAKELSSNVKITREGLLIGTPLYMAPEQLAGQEVGVTADVYSFAAVIYEAFTGRTVTIADNLPAIMSDIAQVDPPRVSRLVAGVPPEVDAALEAALAKRPEARPLQVDLWAQALADRLERLPSAVVGWPAEATVNTEI